MCKNGRVQLLIMLAIGSLLGFLTASGNFPLGRQANAAPEVPISAAIQAASLVAGQAGEQKQAITFRVRLPANAALQIDDDKTTETGEVRTFQTPPLPKGGRYHYTLKATVGGKTVTREISLSQGAANTIDLRPDFSASGAAYAAAAPVSSAARSRALAVLSRKRLSRRPRRKDNSARGNAPRSSSRRTTGAMPRPWPLSGPRMRTTWMRRGASTRDDPPSKKCTRTSSIATRG
jgi:uncharacterized protein (TIGR03000 family)